MIGLFIALISGALMSVQGVFNTQVTKASSIWAASAFVQLTALMVCLGACMDMLGPAKAVMLIVVAQLMVAYVIELLGWFGAEKQPWEWRKALGMAVAILGIVIFKWK